MKSNWLAEILHRLFNTSAGGTSLPAIPTDDQIAVASASTTWILGYGALITAVIVLAILSSMRKK
jgi:hypothetical protein